MHINLFSLLTAKKEREPSEYGVVVNVVPVVVNLGLEVPGHSAGHQGHCVHCHGMICW